MSEADAILRNEGEPVTQDRLVRDLSHAGVEPGMVLLVHTALSQLGWVCGGAVTVIRALQTCLHAHGTLVMPTHSGDWSDPALWENPPVPERWWETIRETMPAFEPEMTPTRGMGRTAELFRTIPGVLRSDHPQVSFAACGDDAVSLLDGHSLEDGLGEQSPLARLYELDAWVLLLGAGFASNTSFHLAEYRADHPTKQRVLLGGPVLVDGHRRWKTFGDINYSSNDFDAIGRAFVRHHKQSVRVAKIGAATCYLFRQREAVDFAEKWLPTHRLRDPSA